MTGVFFLLGNDLIVMTGLFLENDVIVVTDFFLLGNDLIVMTGLFLEDNVNCDCFF